MQNAIYTHYWRLTISREHERAKCIFFKYLIRREVVPKVGNTIRNSYPSLK